MTIYPVRISPRKAKRAKEPKPRKPIQKSGRPRARNAKRSARRFESDFGGEAYHDFIVSHPCDVCGVYGFTVAAHLTARGAGGKAVDTGPLCCSRLGVEGCHERYDDYDPETRKHEPRLRKLAKERRSLWLSRHPQHEGDKK